MRKESGYRLLGRMRDLEDEDTMFGEKCREGSREIFQSLVVQGGFGTGECKDMVGIVKTRKLMGVQHHVCKAFVTKSVPKLLGGRFFLKPASERVFMEWIGCQRWSIKMEWARLANEEKVCVGGEMCLDILGGFIVVKGSCRKLSRRFLPEGNLLRRKHQGMH